MLPSFEEWDKNFQNWWGKQCFKKSPQKEESFQCPYTLFYLRSNEAFYTNWSQKLQKLRIMAVYLTKICLSFSFLWLIYAQISHLCTEGRWDLQKEWTMDLDLREAYKQPGWLPWRPGRQLADPTRLSDIESFYLFPKRQQGQVLILKEKYFVVSNIFLNTFLLLCYLDCILWSDHIESVLQGSLKVHAVLDINNKKILLATQSKKTQSYMLVKTCRTCWAILH